MNNDTYCYPERPTSGHTVAARTYAVRFIVFLLMPLLREAPDARA